MAGESGLPVAEAPAHRHLRFSARHRGGQGEADARADLHGTHQVAQDGRGMVLLKYRFGTFQICPSLLLENSNYEPSGTFSKMED